MDLWKILLAGILAVGVVLLLLPGSGPEEVPGLSGGVLIEEGTYVVERSGQRVGEEAFTLWLVDSGFRLASSARLNVDGQRSEASASLVLDPEWNPIYYVEAGKERVAVHVADDKPTVVVGSGWTRRSTKLVGSPPFVVLGVDTISPWCAAYRLLQARARTTVQATALLPSARATASLSGSLAGPAGLIVRGRTLPVERYRVRLGEWEIWLYGQGDLLLGGSSPSEGTTFYMQEMLPDGLHVAP